MRQGGFTLIELMVTLLIASVLLLAISINYIASQRSYTLLEGLSELQENARFSMDVLSRSIRIAGYKQDPAAETIKVFPADATFPVAGQVIVGGNNGGANGSDTITVRYEGNAAGTTTNCLGGAVAAGVIAVDTFSVDATKELECSTGGAPMPLADGVENMQILYGVDTNFDKVADVYKNAAGVTASEWVSVVSVRIAMLFTSVHAAPGTRVTQGFTLLDNGAQTFTDTLRRQMFTTTITIRNRTP